MKAYAYELVVAEASAAGVGTRGDGVETGRRHRGEDGQTERPADLLAGVEQGGRHPGVLLGTPATAEDVTLTKAPPIPVPMSTSDGGRSR